MSQGTDGSGEDEHRKAAVVARVQTGVRLEKRLVKVLKGLAEYGDISLGELMEAICLHALAGSDAFGQQTRDQITALKSVYGLDLAASSSPTLAE